MFYAGLEKIAEILFSCQLHPFADIEKLPPPPCIIAANHVSPYDPIILVLQLYPWLKKYNKKIMFLTNRKILTLFGPFYKFFGMFPNTREGLKRAIGYLRDGLPVGIFPNRDRDKHFMRMFHLGPAYLSREANVDIIPIAIKTKEEVWPSWNITKALKNLFYKKYLILGNPINANNYRTLRDATKALTIQIAQLIGKKLRF
ncbi:MAG: lysophospholipid acyltransferase family protein [candidate division WOR-3 bacterium]